jgi:hypothetical protein
MEGEGTLTASKNRCLCLIVKNNPKNLLVFLLVYGLAFTVRYWKLREVMATFYCLALSYPLTSTHSDRSGHLGRYNAC